MRSGERKAGGHADDHGEEVAAPAISEPHRNDETNERVRRDRPHTAPRQQRDPATERQDRATIDDGSRTDSGREHPRHQSERCGVWPPDPDEHQPRQSVREAADTRRHTAEPTAVKQSSRTRHGKQNRKGGDQAGCEPRRNEGVDEVGDRDTIGEHRSS